MFHGPMSQTGAVSQAFGPHTRTDFAVPPRGESAVADGNATKWSLAVMT
ncbi:hypothetical protein GCM10012284_44350 [Mangrovihabitans endophyticus]|uniref:Uncharacterized protein n=1 Tax=Mangrovihabitans endophyticus TaxID=1751298 RepID=A0A8J3FRB0_9ACTN|nr:hypothetical protein GCM10012284_44350 [Mangrovihabitans endophyticus]